MHPEEEIKFRDMRSELIRIANSLSNTTYQETQWGRHDTSTNHYDDFDLAISFLYDDASLNINPCGAIGEILRNEAEAFAVSCLTGAIDSLLDKYGTTLSDREYMQKPEWRAIVNYADELKSKLAQED